MSYNPYSDKFRKEEKEKEEKKPKPDDSKRRKELEDEIERVRYLMRISQRTGEQATSELQNLERELGERQREHNDYKEWWYSSVDLNED